jgi:hypothetical protein
MFFSRDLNLLNLLLRFMRVLCLAMIQTRAYHFFNKDSDCVETTCDAVFDETNSSQVEQYDFDNVDDEEALCDALRKMVVDDVRPQETNEDQPSSNEVASPTQVDDQNQEGEQDKDDDHDHNGQ